MNQIVKIGSACLFDEAGQVNYDTLAKKCREIERSLVPTTLVVSGAIALGKYVEQDSRSNSELSNVELQGYACSGQVELMQLYSSLFEQKRVSQLLVTENDLAYTQNIKWLIDHCLSKGQIPIVNYNDAIDFEELRLDNDTLAGKILEYCGAERLVILGHYDGFMDYSNGKIVDTIWEVTDEMYAQCQGQSKHGNGGFSAKLDVGKNILELDRELIISNIDSNLQDIIDGKVARTAFRKKKVHP